MTVRQMAVVVLLLLPTVALGQNLWGGTRAGMTLNQVRGLYPKMYELEQDAHRPPTFRLDGVDISGHQYKALFQFKDAQLERVTLGLTDKVDNGEGLVIGRELMNTLDVKYGTAIEKRGWDNDQPYARICEAVWRAGRTDIELSLLLQPGFNALVSVTYSAALAKEADKL